jgi:hypothetical protein
VTPPDLKPFRFVRNIHRFLQSPSIKSPRNPDITFYLLPLSSTTRTKISSSCSFHVAGVLTASAHPGGTSVFPAEMRGWIMRPSACSIISTRFANEATRELIDLWSNPDHVGCGLVKRTRSTHQAARVPFEGK